MLAVLVSVFLSVLVTVALLLVTRQRLARQFEDIQRRLGQLERIVAELKLDRERSTVPVQLQRLHLGLVQAQEDVARRFGPLLRASGGLGEYQLSGLEHWTNALGGTVSREEIVHLAGVVGPAESADRMDALAGILALFRWRAARLVIVDNAAAQSRSLAALAPRWFREVAWLAPTSAAGAQALFASADKLPDEATLGRLEPGALLIVSGCGADEAAAISGFHLLAAEWRTAVYERTANAAE